MDDRTRQRVRDMIQKEEFKHKNARHQLGNQHSLISKYALGIMGVMVAFVAAFQDVGNLAIAFTIGFLLLLLILGLYSQKISAELEKEMNTSEQRIAALYDKLLGRER